MRENRPYGSVGGESFSPTQSVCRSPGARRRGDPLTAIPRRVTQHNVRAISRSRCFARNLYGHVQTARGPIDVSELGRTLIRRRFAGATSLGFRLTTATTVKKR